MPTFTAGTFTPPTPTVPGGAFAGNVRILSCSNPVLNAKGGYKITFKYKSQGQCTYSF
jgi:hypothetical protein